MWSSFTSLSMTLADLLASVRRVEVRTNRLVNDVMVGAYLSHFKGRGMDFEELREYIPGDDVRDIDWNVTYRMNRVFVKRWREERELGLILAVDVSASGDFGSVRASKREFAAEVAATLAFSAARNGDKVGLLLFSDRAELFVPPRKGRRHLLRVIREVLNFQPAARRTDITAALTTLNRILHRRSIIFLLTDFLHSEVGRAAPVGQASSLSRPAGFQPAGANQPAGRMPAQLTGQDARATTEAARRGLLQEIGLTNARHDLVCVHLSDPRESELPRAGLLTVEDAETGELLEVDTSREAARQTYARVNAERLADLDRALRQAVVDTLRLSAGEDFAPTLQRFFETRRGRRRG